MVAAMSTPTHTTALPLAPGRWLVDPNHSSVTFAIRHLGLSKVRGRFNSFDVALEIGTSLAETRLEARVDMTSIDTGIADRDAHVRSPELLDVERYPEMRFVSTEITGSGESWQVTGQATIKDQTRLFSLEVDFGGLSDFMDDRHAGFGASGQIRRKDFGLDFALPPGGAVLLGDVVSFDLDVQLLEPR